jgi:hypothetical protein
MIIDNDSRYTFTDAKSFLKGKRVFLDHFLRVNDEGANNLYVSHQFNYENKFFEYNQATVPSTVGSQRLLDLEIPM